MVPPSDGHPSQHVRTPGRGPPVTGMTLLARLRDGSAADAWREFVRLYGPVVYGFARTRGLQDADAAVLMQDVLLSVVRDPETSKYDPARGTFDGWLYAVTRNRIDNFLSRRRNRPKGTEDADAYERLGATPAPPGNGPDEAWEREYQRRLTARAMEWVKPEFQGNRWTAFWGTAIEGRPAEAVGVELRMPPGAVYVAKCRVLVRLRDEVRRLQVEIGGL